MDAFKVFKHFLCCILLPVRHLQSILKKSSKNLSDNFVSLYDYSYIYITYCIRNQGCKLLGVYGYSYIYITYKNPGS